MDTEGYSGSDIAVVVREALMEPIRKCQEAKQFIKDSSGYYHPCVEFPNCPICPMLLYKSVNNPDIRNDVFLPGQKCVCTSCHAERMTLYDVQPDLLVVPKIDFDDFKKALTKAHSSVGTDELERFVSWTQEFGQEG